MPVIETGPDKWRSSARPSSYTRKSIFWKGLPSDLVRGWPPAFCRKCDSKWWEVDGIEPLAKKDCVYSAATAPACPYLHFPNWRKREVLIPNGARPSISLRTSAGRLSGYVSAFGGRLSARCSYAEAYHSLSKRCRHPDRLAFQDQPSTIGGAVRCRSPHVAVPRVFKTRCRAVGDRSVFGVPSEIRTPYLPLRRRMLCSNELRERVHSSFAANLPETRAFPRYSRNRYHFR